MKTNKSTNYDWFQFLANNRKISKRHLQNLKRQFEEYGNITEISPITVNKNGFIIDGQHRFLLCKEFNMPVYYHEIDTKKEITPAINSNNKSWTAMDYVEFFSAYKPEYKLLSEFIRRNEVNYYLAASVLFPNSSNGRVYEKLRKGEVEVSHIIKEAQERMNFVHEVNQVMGIDITERYCRGLMHCLEMENFDTERFLTKLKRMVKSPSRNLLQPRATTTSDVLRNIETIYNHHVRGGNTVLLFR